MQYETIGLLLSTRLLLLAHISNPYMWIYIAVFILLLQGSLLEMVLRSCSIPSRLEATLFVSAQKYGATLYQSRVREAIPENIHSKINDIMILIFTAQRILESSIFLSMLVSKECTISWDQNNKLTSQYQTSSLITGKHPVNYLLNELVQLFIGWASHSSSAMK